MKRTILTAIATASLFAVGAPAAQANQPAPHCKVLSVTSVRVPVDGPVHYRVTTTERCRGKVVTVVTVVYV